MLATVQMVFDGMRTRDTALLAQAFDTSGRLVGVSNRGGTPAVTLTTRAAWKITQIADSRRTDGCTHTQPPNG